MNKVYGGTPQHGETSLCKSCRNATIVQGLALSSERTYCANLNDKIMEQPVLKCTAYSNKAEVHISQMQLIAWTLRTDRTGKAIGFVSPKEFNALRRKGEE